MMPATPGESQRSFRKCGRTGAIGLKVEARSRSQSIPAGRLRVLGCTSVWVLWALLPFVMRAQSPLDGFDAGANGTVWAIALQPDGKILAGGNFTLLGGGGIGTVPHTSIGRLNADGSSDTGFHSATNGIVKAIAVQRDGKILIGGAFTAISGGGAESIARYNLGRLNADGSVDTSFETNAGATVTAIVVQPDGKILVGGEFTALGQGVPRKYIGRINTDGTVDTGFNPGAGAPVKALALQPDGKVLVGGAFNSLSDSKGSSSRWHLGRFRPDGSLDADFDPGANGDVTAFGLQADGKILVGGAFTTLGGGSFGLNERSHLGRLYPNGKLDASFDPGANSTVYAIALQSDGKILLGGSFFTLGGGGQGSTVRNNLGRLSAEGGVDDGFDPGANGPVYGMAVQTDTKIVVAGGFTGLGGHGGAIHRSRIGRLYREGVLETDFNPGASAGVLAIALQGDGKVVVGGHFVSLGGGSAAPVPRSHIGRFNADGSVDMSFDPGANDVVTDLVIQPDGRILVAGRFTALGGGMSGMNTRNRIGRLNSDGSLDTGFDPGVAGEFVSGLALQSNGQILVGGSFHGLGGGSGLSPVVNIGRLNPDGSIDADFRSGSSGAIQALAVQQDGKILVGGNFAALGRASMTARSNIGRLNSDGSLDISFDPGANGTVFALLPQPDGRILVGGSFTALGGGGTGSGARSRLGRLNPDGSLDGSFDPGANETVYALAGQADGRILAAGNFTALGGGGTGSTARSRLGRLNPDGTIDAGFATGCDGPAMSLALQADGKILVGGSFTGLLGSTGAAPRLNIGRLANTEGAQQELYVNAPGSTVTWKRGGASPEVDRVTMESSPDGNNFTRLGSASRIPEGWKLTGLSLPMGEVLFVRARGYYATGYGNGSGSMTETVLPAASVTGVFAQVAAGGSYQTILTGINTDRINHDVHVSLVRSDGTPFKDAAGNPMSPAQFSLPPMGTLRFQAALPGGTVAGYGVFAGNAPIDGTALFRSLQGNTIISEAGVGLSKPAQHFTVYIDNTQNAASGYAVANNGGKTATLNLTLRGNDGGILDWAVVSLPPGHHFAEYADQRFPVRAAAGFEGSIEFSSDQKVAAVALRYDNTNLSASNHVFSTIPVLVDEADKALYFPQVAEGGGYRTNFILLNPQDTPARVALQFFDSDGNPLVLRIGGQLQTGMEILLNAKGVTRFFTEGDSPDPKDGWVRVTSQVSILGSSIFQTRSADRILSEAGVASSPLSQHFTTYVESLGSAWSGIAICNPHDTPTTLTLNLRQSDGRISMTKDITLPPYGHDAKFFTDPAWFPQAEEFEGTLEVIASAPVSAVALRYDNPDHSVFATLPVILLR